jgi:hypothetical protein
MVVLQSSTSSAIRSLAPRSSCNLQCLCVEKRHINDEDLIPCTFLSHLYLVVLGESAVLSKFFVLMVHPSRDPLLVLPNLTWFHYKGLVE